MTLFSRLWFLVFFFSLSAFAGLSSQGALPLGVVPLSGVDPSLPDAELSVLDRVADEATFLAIGESVHGSAGYRLLQHRIAKYLIGKKNYRTFLLENAVIRSEGLSKWLASCTQAVSAPPIDLLYQPIEEDRAFFEWLCTYNSSHSSDPVAYRGMDIWDRPWERQAALESIDARLSLGFEASLKTTREHCWFHDDSSWDHFMEKMKVLAAGKQIPAVDYDPCVRELSSMSASVESRLQTEFRAPERVLLQEASLQLSSSLGYLNDFHQAYRSFVDSFNSRDQAQGLNEFQLFQQMGEKKTFLFAHISHVAKEKTPSSWWGPNREGMRSGVYYLSALLGPEKVRTIGLTGYHVTGVQGDWLIPTSPDSLDLTLHGIGLSVAYVDPTSDFIRAKTRWWMQNENAADAIPDGVFMVPEDNYDGIFFVDETLVGKGILPWRDVWNW